MQELHRQQQQLAEVADTRMRVAKDTGVTARDEVKETHREIQANVNDITDVFRVHRDLIDDLRMEPQEKKEEQDERRKSRDKRKQRREKKKERREERILF